MRFRTELDVHPAQTNIDHTHSCFLIGSCFTDHIGMKLTQFKFDTLVNPYGTIYHPLPLLNQLTNALGNNLMIEDYIIPLEDRYVHFGYHSDCSASSPEKLAIVINERNNKVRSFLSNADYTIITLGTAALFKLSKDNYAVANCHKQPRGLFERAMTSVTDLIEILRTLVSLIHTSNDNIHILFTVSPVRHLADGLVANARSKAHLLSAVHTICDSDSSVSYFPAYEFVLDDLRDYRFYKEDLTHPNQMAIDYIWEKFSKRYFTEKTNSINQQLTSFYRTLQHRPFDPQGASHKKMLSSLKDKIQEFQSTNKIDLSDELKLISSRLTAGTDESI